MNFPAFTEKVASLLIEIENTYTFMVILLISLSDKMYCDITLHEFMHYETEYSLTSSLTHFHMKR